TGRADTAAVAAAFAPYRSILARYLWRIKDTAPAPAADPVGAPADEPVAQDPAPRTRRPRGAARSG
ncbi:DNA-3-methyladenine glycosylase 2 family protein, partial [Methylobacterium organophilum]|nr:DNA-3-methyladenine glycosylase 2 family protein [Methylobacterium organophilum]